MTVLWLTILKPDESEFGTYGINASIAFLAMVIIGGLGSVPGAVVGALLVYGLPQVLALATTGSDLFSTTGGGGLTPVILTQFIYGGAIVALVLFEPRGLAGVGRRLQAWIADRRAHRTADDAASSETSQDGDRP